MSAQQESIREHQLKTDTTNMCGVTFSDSMEARAVIEVMEDKPGVTVTKYPAMYRIDAQDKITFDMDEISEVLGSDMDPYTFQIELSTHYGRLAIIDDQTVVLFGNLDEYLETVGAVEDED